MSALSIQVPFPVFQGRDGQPLENGYVWIGEPNLNAQTNPVTVYFDAALTIPAPQPLRTLNGYVSRAGTPAQVYVDGVNFSILVQDSKGSMVYNFPQGTGISPDASGVNFYPPGGGGVTNLQARGENVIYVTDYANLAVMTAARSPGDPASHLLLNFLNWTPAIQAALDEADSRGGGVVILDKNTVPYYVQDPVYAKSNTTFICEDWMVLADYNFIGGTFGAIGENILVINIKIDNSNIFAGGSGYNGIGAQGKNIKFYGGHIKNCARGFDPDPLSPNDGGKGCQLEAGGMESVVIDGITFSNCFMAMSTIRGYEDPENIYGIVYNNITADNCDIFFFVRQTNGYDQTGLEHSIQLNNFYAVNCGAFEGVFQFSRASNVKISNGTVVNDPGTAATSLIRGHHANTTFDNVAFYGDAPAVIFLDPGTYNPDNSYANVNNRYNIDVWGTVQWLALSTNGTSFNTLDGCTGRVSFRNDPTVDWFSSDMRNGASVFEVSRNTGPFGSSKFATLTTSVNYTGSAWPGNFNELDLGNTHFLAGIGFVGGDSARDDILDNYEQGTFTPTVTATSGSGTFTSAGSYIRVGDMVTAKGLVTFTSLGTLSGRLIFDGFPYPAKTGDGTWDGSTSLRFVNLTNISGISSKINTGSPTGVEITLTDSVGTGGSNLQASNCTSSTVVTFTITYRA